MVPDMGLNVTLGWLVLEKSITILKDALLSLFFRLCCVCLLFFYHSFDNTVK